MQVRVEKLKMIHCVKRQASKVFHSNCNFRYDFIFNPVDVHESTLMHSFHSIIERKATAAIVN